MAGPPEFLTRPPVPVMSEETFRPAVTGRRGEFAAWAGVASLAVLSVVMAWRTQRFPTVAFGLLVFFLLAAVFTSLGSSMTGGHRCAFLPMAWSTAAHCARFTWTGTRCKR
jgi:hypothetical protein